MVLLAMPVKIYLKWWVIQHSIVDKYTVDRLEIAM